MKQMLHPTRVEIRIAKPRFKELFHVSIFFRVSVLSIKRSLNIVVFSSSVVGELGWIHLIGMDVFFAPNRQSPIYLVPFVFSHLVLGDNVVYRWMGIGVWYQP